MRGDIPRSGFKKESLIHDFHGWTPSKVAKPCDVPERSICIGQRERAIRRDVLSKETGENLWANWVGESTSLSPIHLRYRGRSAASASRTYLGVDADDFVALLAAISEHALVALDAVRMLVPEDVALPGQRLVALPAAEVAAVPVLVHRLRVLATENQLETKTRGV